MKKIISRLLFISMVAFFYSCSSKKESEQGNVLRGNAQGTTFSIKYYGEELVEVQDSVSQILEVMDQNFSLWRDSSIISRWNVLEGEMSLPYSGHFEKLIQKSKEINVFTSNAFDPTLHPVISAWGFSRKKGMKPTKEEIDSLLKLSNFSDWTYPSASKEGAMEQITLKETSGSLDLNAIAQGYTVDVLSDYFTRNGRIDHFIEVGGETITQGLKPKNKKWIITIDKPFGKNLEHIAQDTVFISNKALVTSGNYRKTVEINGKKYSHTIDPSTGYPVDHQLLSATVIANECADADAYATAFMVMGVEKTIEFLKATNYVDGVYLIYEENFEMKTYISDGFKKYLKP